MLQTDLALLINWLVSGLIGLLFGVVGGYVTYKLERKRDDIKWAREKEQLELSWKHDKEQMELSWQQKLQELEIQFIRDDQNKLRQELLRGIDNPRATLAQYIDNQAVLKQSKVQMLKSLLENSAITSLMMESIGKELIEKLLENPAYLKELESSSPNPQLSSNAEGNDKETG